MDQDTRTGSFKPEIVVLCCQHCISPKFDLKSNITDASGLMKLRLEVMPCSSKVETAHLLKIFEQGVDGIEVVVCPVNQCRFLVGSARAKKRIEYARSLLDQIGMGADRIGMDQGKGLKFPQLLELASKRAKTVLSLGPNPMKGGK